MESLASVPVGGIWDAGSWTITIILGGNNGGIRRIEMCGADWREPVMICDGSDVMTATGRKGNGPVVSMCVEKTDWGSDGKFCVCFWVFTNWSIFECLESVLFSQAGKKPLSSYETSVFQIVPSLPSVVFGLWTIMRFASCVRKAQFLLICLFFTIGC